MDLPKKIEIAPLPLEKELIVAHTRTQLKELSREELETFLIDSLDLVVRLSHQVRQLSQFFEEA